MLQNPPVIPLPAYLPSPIYEASVATVAFTKATQVVLPLTLSDVQMPYLGKSSNSDIFREKQYFPLLPFMTKSRNNCPNILRIVLGISRKQYHASVP